MVAICGATILGAVRGIDNHIRSENTRDFQTTNQCASQPYRYQERGPVLRYYGPGSQLSIFTSDAGNYYGYAIALKEHELSFA
jgi:hypothetical protein